MRLILEAGTPHWVWGDNGDVPNSAGVARVPASTALKAAAGLGAIGISLSGMYAITGIGIPCPWRLATHTLCPFCGSTTMGAALLRGDLAAAWAANPFVLTMLAGLAVACVCWIVELRGGPALRLPTLLSGRLTFAAFVAAAIAFAVWRNLVPPF